MRLSSVLAALLILCSARCASAQAVGSGAAGGPNDAGAPAAASGGAQGGHDDRSEYPAFLTRSYFGIGFGSIGYLFSGRQLEPGFQAASTERPRLATRVDLFGHHFSKHIAAQVSYMRPVRFVAYENVNGDRSRHEVAEAYGGLTLVGEVPLSRRVSAYGEGGVGITSRSSFEIDGVTVVKEAHFAAGLLGGGLEYHATRTLDLLLSATYSPGRRAFNQPSTRLFTTGVRYQIRPPPASAAPRGSGDRLFPASVVRLGYTTNLLGYQVNSFFSRVVPIFWGGHVRVRRGFTLDYQRNVFHTKSRFSFDLGASASYWKSSTREIFRTLSVYPLFRLTLLRRRPADLYVTYSLAGPTYLSRPVIDGRDTGARFTFQDFMGVGLFLGDKRRTNVELGIKHYSNGNIFPRNASIRIPLTLTLGRTF